MPENPRRKLGQLLVQAGLLDESQLGAALDDHRRSGRHLGATLVDMGLLSESVLTRALASQLGLPIVTLSGKQIHPDILELLPAEWAIKYDVVPLFIREESDVPTLFVGIGDPTDRAILAEVRNLVEMPAAAVVVAPSELEDALSRFYGSAQLGDHLDDAADNPSAPGNTPMEPARSVRSLAERQLDDSLGAGAGAGDAPSSRTVVKALAQLLIEKGLIQRDELNDRVVALHADRTRE
jgi:hypothetical protein